MPFEGLIALATEKLRDMGFDPLDPGGGERHGAWDWTWIKPRAEDGQGYYYAALSAVASEDEGNIYRMEVWTGADKGDRFGRYLVRAFPGVRDGQPGETVWSWILDSLEEAARIAPTFPDAALTGTYIR